MVRPSRNNMHEFVAEENTCFFDICLPNYTADSLRRITYFKEQNEESFNPIDTIDSTMSSSSRKPKLLKMSFDSTPPVLPRGMEVADLPYYGQYEDPMMMMPTMGTSPSM